ncbi:MAG: hypothetical protein JWQ84_1278 [Mucilaginibacter sp.]|nr:hypothetical protein [Mucilaginibacter sp.]
MQISIKKLKCLVKTRDMGLMIAKNLSKFVFLVYDGKGIALLLYSEIDKDGDHILIKVIQYI